MDSQEMLASAGQFVVGVLGCTERDEDFCIIRFDGDFDAAIAEARDAGFDFCAGVMAVVNGRAGAKCNPGPDSARVMLAAAFEYARQVADHIRPQPIGDEVEWLKRLYALPDTREM